MQSQSIQDRKGQTSLLLWSRKTFSHQALRGGTTQVHRLALWVHVSWTWMKLWSYDTWCRCGVCPILNFHFLSTGRCGRIRSTSFKEDLHGRKCYSEIALYVYIYIYTQFLLLLSKCMQYLFSEGLKCQSYTSTKLSNSFKDISNTFAYTPDKVVTNKKKKTNHRKHIC